MSTDNSKYGISKADIQKAALGDFDDFEPEANAQPQVQPEDLSSVDIYSNTGNYVSDDVTDESFIFCTECGRKLPESAKFCTGCGTTIAAQPAAESIYDYNDNTQFYAGDDNVSLMFCTSCGAQLSADLNFCTNCGTPVVSQQVTPENNCTQFEPDSAPIMFCTSCGAQLSADLNFCTNCGTPVFLQQTAPEITDDSDAKTQSYQLFSNDGNDVVSDSDYTQILPDSVPMTFCTSCGTQISADLNFCTNCGTPVSAAPIDQNQYGNMNYAYQNPAADNNKSFFSKFKKK